MEKQTLLVEKEEAGIRLDVFLSGKLNNSRASVQRLINEGLVRVDNIAAKANYKLKLGDIITYFLEPPRPLEVTPEDIKLDIVYEDNDLLVVNKPQGLVVHPAHGNFQGTLVNALLYHCRDLSGINGVLRPGIVHRIDKDTSGLLVVAKNDFTHQGLAEQMKDHSVKRVYVALVHGVVSEPGGIIETPLGRDARDRQKMAVVNSEGKMAITHYKVLERFSEYSLVECRLKTGRTHQIRVHMAYLNHPVVGDQKYGPRKSHLGLAGQALHAHTLSFRHPRTEEKLVFTAAPPAEFLEILAKLGSKIFTEEGDSGGEIGKDDNS